MLIEFCSDVCSILGIEVPALSFDVSHFESDTMMAQCDFDDGTIFLKPFDKPTPDICFAICHELRHLWQYKEDYEYFLGSYLPLSLCVSLEEYNLQVAEVDANAFAGLMMEDFFEITPLFSGLSDAVKARIYDRMDFLDAIL